MFEYRRVDDLTAVSEMAKSAFAIRCPDHDTVQTWLNQSIADGRELYGVYEGDTLLAVYLLYDYRMRLRDSIVPMGGIGLLCSRLDARGKGAARFMIERSLETMREKAQVISVLSPFSQSFYRKYGWEMFSRYQEVEVAPGGLEIPEPRETDPEYDLVDLPQADDSAMAFYNEHARTHHTLVERSTADWRRRTEVLPWNADAAARGVVRVSRDARVVGLIGYSLSRKPDEWPPTYAITLFVYEDASVKRAMLRYLKRLSHQIKTLRFELPLDEDLWPYFSDAPDKRRIRDMFMARIVSIEALEGLAIDAEDMSIAVEIADPQAAWNARTWSLAVADGRLHVAPADAPADLRCGIGALSSVLSGFTDFATLIAAERVEPLASYQGQDLPRVTTFLADYF